MNKKDELAVLIELERSKLNREKSVLVLDKALLLYFSFIFIGILGFINKFIGTDILNLLVLMSFGVLLIGIAPYLVTMHKEDKRMESLLNSIKSPKNRGGKDA
ncbi:MAG: hypothetical protein GY861_04445 [bacterium]|nr:hypothetical protein [bacterium]